MASALVPVCQTTLVTPTKDVAPSARLAQTAPRTLLALEISARTPVLVPVDRILSAKSSITRPLAPATLVTPEIRSDTAKLLENLVKYTPQRAIHFLLEIESIVLLICLWGNVLNVPKESY